MRVAYCLRCSRREVQQRSAAAVKGCELLHSHGAWCQQFICLQGLTASALQEYIDRLDARETNVSHVAKSWLFAATSFDAYLSFS